MMCANSPKPTNMKGLVGGPAPVAPAVLLPLPRKCDDRSSCRTSLTSALSLSALSEFSLDAAVDAPPDENYDGPRLPAPAGTRSPPPEFPAQRRQAAHGCNLTARVLEELGELKDPDPGSSRDEDDEDESSQTTISSPEESLKTGNLKEWTTTTEKSVQNWSRRGLSFAADTGPSSFLVDSDDSLNFLDSDTSLDWSEEGDAARSPSWNENDNGDADDDGDDGDGDGGGDGNENDDGDDGDKRGRSGSCDDFEDQLRQMGESRVVTSRNDGAAAANARKSDRLKILSWSQTYSHAIQEGDEESSLGSLGSLDSSVEEGGARGRRSRW